jgi:hypothetical protein
MLLAGCAVIPATYAQTQQGLENRAGVWEGQLSPTPTHPEERHLTLWIRLNKSVPRGAEPVMLVTGKLRMEAGADSKVYTLSAAHTKLDGQQLTFSCFVRDQTGQEVFTGEKFTGTMTESGEGISGTWETGSERAAVEFSRPSGTSEHAAALVGTWAARSRDELCTLHIYATRSGGLLSTLDVFRERGGVFGQLTEITGPGAQGEIAMVVPEMGNQRLVLSGPPANGAFEGTWSPGKGFCGEGTRSQFTAMQ